MSAPSSTVLRNLIDAEVGHVLRRGKQAGEISEETARPALRALPEMIDYR
jgi:hypothetical protein